MSFVLYTAAKSRLFLEASLKRHLFKALLCKRTSIVVRATDRIHAYLWGVVVRGIT